RHLSSDSFPTRRPADLAAYKQMVFLTSKRVTNSETALVKDSQRKSGSGPESRRNGLPSVSLSTRISKSNDSTSTGWSISMVTAGDRKSTRLNYSHDSIS